MKNNKLNIIGSMFQSTIKSYLYNGLKYDDLVDVNEILKDLILKYNQFEGNGAALMIPDNYDSKLPMFMMGSMASPVKSINQELLDEGIERFNEGFTNSREPFLKIVSRLVEDGYMPDNLFTQILEPDFKEFKVGDVRIKINKSNTEKRERETLDGSLKNMLDFMITDEGRTQDVFYSFVLSNESGDLIHRITHQGVRHMLFDSLHVFMHQNRDVIMEKLGDETYKMLLKGWMSYVDKYNLDNIESSLSAFNEIIEIDPLSEFREMLKKYKHQVSKIQPFNISKVLDGSFQSDSYSSRIKPLKPIDYLIGKNPSLMIKEVENWLQHDITEFPESFMTELAQLNEAIVATTELDVKQFEELFSTISNSKLSGVMQPENRRDAAFGWIKDHELKNLVFSSNKSSRIYLTFLNQLRRYALIQGDDHAYTNLTRLKADYLRTIEGVNRCMQVFGEKLKNSIGNEPYRSESDYFNENLSAEVQRENRDILMLALSDSEILARDCLTKTQDWLKVTQSKSFDKKTSKYFGDSLFDSFEDLNQTRLTIASIEDESIKSQALQSIAESVIKAHSDSDNMNVFIRQISDDGAEFAYDYAERIVNLIEHKSELFRAALNENPLMLAHIILKFTDMTSKFGKSNGNKALNEIHDTICRHKKSWPNLYIGFMSGLLSRKDNITQDYPRFIKKIFNKLSSPEKVELLANATKLHEKGYYHHHEDERLIDHLSNEAKSIIFGSEKLAQSAIEAHMMSNHNVQEDDAAIEFDNTL